MASNHTTNYQLCQWEATDKVLRTDFNEDNAKIDAALSAHDAELEAQGTALEGKASSGALSALTQRTTALENREAVVSGTYTGNGSSVTVNLGFKPKFLFIAAPHPNSGYSYDELFAMGNESCMTAQTRSNGPEVITSCSFTDTGFSITSSSSGGLNRTGDTNYYTAFR